MNNNCPTQMDYYLVGRECYDCETGDKVAAEKCLKKYDEEYMRVGRRILEEGQWKTNKRTGTKCLTVIGDMMKFDMRETNQFPLLTTKKMNLRPVVAELLGFIKGYDNAADFRKEGCKIWDANANENKQWLNNPNRKGTDDLGRIYGVQARGWRASNGETIDQLKNCIRGLKKRNDNRRLLVSHWNPGEADLMALLPCHLTYQFSLSSDDTLDLLLYQRSCDFPIGIPFNIASYCIFLKMVADITGLKTGTFTHFMADIHIYENQLDLFMEQMEREPYFSPELVMPDIDSLENIENGNISADDFILENYTHHDFIKYPFSV